MDRRIVAVGLAALVAGCSSGTHPGAAQSGAAPSTATTAPPTATSTTVATAVYGQKYLAIIGPFNQAIHGLPANPGPAQLAALAQTITRSEGSLLAVRWPGQTETDVHSMVTDMGQLAAAVYNDDASAVETAGQAVITAAAIVRSDLGLPRNV